MVKMQDLHGTKGGGRASAEICDHMDDSTHRGFDMAEGSGDRLMMHPLPTLAVLLVVNRQSDRCGSQEYRRV